MSNKTSVDTAAMDLDTMPHFIADSDSWEMKIPYN